MKLLNTKVLRLNPMICRFNIHGLFLVLFVVLVVVPLSGCSGQWHLQRAKQKAPQLFTSESDTVIVDTTIYIDTTITLERDSFEFNTNLTNLAFDRWNVIEDNETHTIYKKPIGNNKFRYRVIRHKVDVNVSIRENVSLMNVTHRETVNIPFVITTLQWVIIGTIGTIVLLILLR